MQLLRLHIHSISTHNSQHFNCTDIQHQRMAWPSNMGLRSFNVIENGAVRLTIFDFLLVGHCNYSSILYHFLVFWHSELEIGVRGDSRSLKLVPFESLGAVSYSLSIVTVAVSVAVCEIFSVKEWRDHENQVMGGSKSLKMALFDRQYSTFYWSAIVTIALSCTIF